LSDRDAYIVLNVQPDAHQLVIQAAYRVLAALYHPDRGESLASTRRMAELNQAYASVRTPAARAAYDKQRLQHAERPSVMTTPPPRADAKAPPKREGVLDFGRYKGWAVADLARHDPDYLRWLSRHSSGVAYRSEIEAVLASTTPRGTTATDRVFGRR
jgi:curved DNA-binding protein CbpA